MLGLSLFFLLNYVFIPSIGSELKGFDDTILFKIAWPGDKSFLDLHKFEEYGVKTENEETYKCMIPILQEKEETKFHTDNSISIFDLMSELFSKSSCSYRIEAYWTYEICHGHYIRQFHEEREGKSKKVQEYFLGKWNSDDTKKLKERLLEYQNKGVKFNHTKVYNIKHPYLELEMTDGTLCDINSQPRVTRVRYVCNLHGKSEIFSLEEKSTCNYEAVVLTSFLCLIPGFQPDNVEENVISCLPSNGATKLPINHLKNEIDTLQFTFRQQSGSTFGLQKSITIVKIDPKDGSFSVDTLNGDLENTNSIADKLAEYEQKIAVQLTKPQITVEDITLDKEFLSGKRCLIGGSDYWQYEYCHGRHVRQFHIEKDKSETSIMLGVFDKGLHVKWLEQNPSKRPKFESKVHNWFQGGSVCEQLGKKRSTEVILICTTDSPNTPTSMVLDEPKLCSYILTIKSPQICDLFKLLDDDGLVSAKYE